MQLSYRVRFSFEKKAGKHAVFSLPQTNEYQEIQELSVEPKPVKLDSDEWGNTVAEFAEKTELRFLYLPKAIEKTINEQFLIQPQKIRNNRFINGQDPRIKKLTGQLVKNERHVAKVARTFYEFVLGYLTYGKPIEGLYPYSQALEEKVTDCGGFSTLLLSLFQSVGIHGRLVVGFVTKEKLLTKLLSRFEIYPLTFEFFSMHAWTEILLPDDSWFPMDPSVEWRRNHNQSKRDGGFGKISSDRLVTSFGQDFSITVHGTKHRIDLLQLPVYL